MKKRRKIPTKIELQQLQKLYKTDERIGDRLGGVPAYLVAYWRRKRNIAKYSLPKFSENEVRTLWERYGDDEKSGLELGISKAAFYNWRRRYGIREKPAFLKLEQLELNFPGSKQPAHAGSLYGKRSVAQKVFARAANLEKVEVGEVVELEPDLVIAPDAADVVIEAFREYGAEYVWNPSKVVLTVGLSGGDNRADPATAHKLVREFARRQNIKTFYDLREGGCHQLILERGLLRPGQLALGNDRRVSAMGCLSALAMAVDTDSIAGIWLNGVFSTTVPGTIRGNVTGRRPRGAYAFDVALSMAKQLGGRAADSRVLEFAGSAISQMTIGERFTLSSLARASGAVSVYCAYDATVRRYLTGRTVSRYQPVVPDNAAEYAELYQVNIERLTPLMARKVGDCADVRPVAEFEETPVHQVILGSGTAGRFEDLRVAADILKGKQVHEDTRLVIIPGSRQVYLEALKKGLIRVFAEAGAIIMNPGGCDTFPASELYLAEGEFCLTTCNSEITADKPNRDVFLCSPAPPPLRRCTAWSPTLLGSFASSTPLPDREPTDRFGPSAGILRTRSRPKSVSVSRLSRPAPPGRVRA
jgi:3-isopropylmalate/(R)-2-methylmalate dehydratase large subunit